MCKFFSLLTFVLVTHLAATALAAPSLEVEAASFDFGEISQGEKVRHVFIFSNVGDETLMIDRVRSSCGCTAALVSDKILEPGETGEVQANFDSTRFSGSVSKTIYLYTNDPVYPTKQLYVKGKIRELVSIKPTQVNFGTVAPKLPVQAKVVVRNQGKETMTLGTPRSTAPELVVKMEDAPFEVGTEIAIDLKLTAKPGQQRFSGYILVPIEGGPQKELRIPVYAEIKP